ncbi:MAG: hypothetical protein QMD50_03530 [Patescibacteria group bacterium]|nr:hypothetical protein [Patescibacteria group bacterium]
MKKSIIAIIVIIILILVAVYVIGDWRVQVDGPRPYQTSEEIQQGQGAENLTQEVEDVDIGNLDQEFQQIDSDLNNL